MTVPRRAVLSLVLVVVFPLVANAAMLFGWVASDPALLVGGFSSQVDWNPQDGYPTIDPNVGFISQAVGRRVGEALAHGRIWWWNPFEGIGFPVGESMTAGGMFPLSVLLALNNGVAIERTVIEMVTGIATWLLMRELGASAVAACVAAIVYSINGTTTWLGTPWADTAPFLPLLLLGVERLRRAAAGGWAIVALSLGLSIVAGFPENAYLYGLLGLGWAIIRIAQSSLRVRFAALLVTSGCAGLLIAAPGLVGFADYLTVAYTGGHLAGSFGHASLAPAGIPQVFLPYVWGPIFADPAETALWDNVGGYAGVGICTLAIVAIFGRTQRAIRWWLLGWSVTTLLATFNTPFVHDAFATIPLVKYTAFFRYLPTSWEFALTILAGFAIDDIRTYRLDAALLRVGGAILVCIAVVMFSLSAGGIDLLADSNRVLRSWTFFSLEAALVVFIGLAVAAAIERERLRVFLLAAVLIGEVSLYYLVTVRSFARSGTLDLAPIAFMQRNLGFQRFYTLGPIAPNYGSYFEIGSINHNDLPVPNRWIDYIHNNLDPYADDIIFVGWYPPSRLGVPSRADELRANVHGYERAGVRYVVTSPNEDPFDGTFASTPGSGPLAPSLLSKNATITFRMSGRVAADELSSIDLVGLSTRTHGSGRIDLRVCDDRANCASGRSAPRDLSGGAIHIEMQRPQRIQPPGLTLTLRIQAGAPLLLMTAPRRLGSEAALAVDGRSVAGRALQVRFGFVRHGRLAYRDKTLAIFELPHPRPYFEAAGCQIDAGDRTRLTASCASSANLHRLELFMPGWHATVNGTPVAVVPFEDAFESIPLPAGRSTIDFWFVPPYVEYGFGACIVALVAVAASLIFDLRARVGVKQVAITVPT